MSRCYCGFPFWSCCLSWFFRCCVRRGKPPARGRSAQHVVFLFQPRSVSPAWFCGSSCFCCTLYRGVPARHVFSIGSPGPRNALYLYSGSAAHSSRFICGTAMANLGHGGSVYRYLQGMCNPVEDHLPSAKKALRVLRIVVSYLRCLHLLTLMSSPESTMVHSLYGYQDTRSRG